jgi:hypothetical protein
MTHPDRYEDDAEGSDEPEISRRSRGVALGLSLVGGLFGLHRFYVGKVQTGIAMALTVGGLGIWYLYDLVLIAAGEFRDADDLPLRNWNVEDVGAARLSARGDRRVDELEDQVVSLQQQFNDLAERLDFAERMLAQQRERPQLPRGS